MAITKGHALQITLEQAAASLKGRLKIVDRIDGRPYFSKDTDIEKCWIVHIEPEWFLLDGDQAYILIDKDTGATTTTKSSGV